MSTADAIARFVADTPFEAIPPGALARARSCLVDTLGAALGGSRLRAGRIAVALVEAEAGAGVATVLTARRKAAISQAAFANAVLASALDVDDGHYGAVGHPGAPVIPPALATAEARRRSGRELLGAVVVGYEIAIRAGEVLNARVGVRSYGSGTPGAYGAAAAVARLLGLDAGRTAHALGIARCHLPVSTVWDSVPYGAMVKESIGWGAITGTVAALLAEQGFTGPETVLDEPHHRAESDLAPLDDLTLVCVFLCHHSSNRAGDRHKLELAAQICEASLGLAHLRLPDLKIGLFDSHLSSLDPNQLQSRFSFFDLFFERR